MFQPFMVRDFLPQLSSDGKTVSVKYSQYQLMQLRATALEFGLDPSRDLNLPPLQVTQASEQVDVRRQVGLARHQSNLFAQQERKRNRLSRKHKRMLMEGKITPAEIDQEVRELEAEFMEAEGRNTPLMLLSQDARSQYEQQKLKVVTHHMKRMDTVLQEWRNRRRNARIKQRDAVFPF